MIINEGTPGATFMAPWLKITDLVVREKLPE